MDLFSFLSRSPARKIERLRKKVKQPHGDASVRINAAYRLLEMDTDEALLALLDRFTIAANPSRQDEEEKQDVFGKLVDCGEKAVPPIIKFLKQNRQVYWPVRILREIQPIEEFARTINEILRFLWEHPPASSEPKAQLIRALEDVATEELTATVRRYLEDEDDDTRLAAIDYFFAQPEEAGREPILQCYLDSEDRPRIRSYVLERFAELGWSVRGFRPSVEESLPNGFSLTREGTVKTIRREY